MTGARVTNGSISCPGRDLHGARHREGFSYSIACAMREQFVDNTGAYRDTFVCRAAISPKNTSILSILPLKPRIGPGRAPHGLVCDQKSRIDRYGRRRINGHVHFPKFGFAGVVRPRDYRSIANARVRVLLRRADF